VIRWTAAATLALALLVSACAAPPKGTDGDLDNEWPAMQAPTTWEPKAGVCVNIMSDTMRLGLYQPRDCQGNHLHEFIHIGTFTETTLPSKESEAYRKAWAECDVKTTELLGGPWRERKLRIGISLPSPEHWEAGARWFGCVANRVKQLNEVSPIGMTSSFKGKFADPELQFDCFQVVKGGQFTVTSCTEPHNAEFAGLVNWDGTWESVNAETDKPSGKDHQLCQRAIATFVGVTNNRSGTWNWLPAEEDWNAGDRSLRCYLWLDDVSVSTSMKGVGVKARPIK
jgi:hypothetical protein